jgi:hypothetical protein
LTLFKGSQRLQRRTALTRRWGELCTTIIHVVVVSAAMIAHRVKRTFSRGRGRAVPSGKHPLRHDTPRRIASSSSARHRRFLIIERGCPSANSRKRCGWGWGRW